jgi:dipeptidyl aminopeptidase/acylaminoacyl peptidase
VAGTVTAAPARAVAPGRFIVSEFHGSETLLFSVSPADLADRRPLVRIEHAANWSPRAAVAPGGDLVAYTVLPAGARSPDTEGTLWVVGLSAREPRRVAARVDVRITPVWSPDGTRVVYQRAVPVPGAGIITSLEEVDVRNGKAQELAHTPPGPLFPAGYAPDARRFYYVVFGREGTMLREIDTTSRAVRDVARLGDGAARDFKLSPDGSFLLYLALEGVPARYHARVADLRTGVVRAVLPQLARSEDVGVAWRPDGRPTPGVGFITAGGAATGQVVTEASAAPFSVTTQGFDVPVAWSSDGRLLLARSFSGRTADDPGREQPVLIDAEGMRRPLSGGGPLELVGWVSDGP